MAVPGEEKHQRFGDRLIATKTVTPASAGASGSGDTGIRSDFRVCGWESKSEDISDTR